MQLERILCPNPEGHALLVGPGNSTKTGRTEVQEEAPQCKALNERKDAAQQLPRGSVQLLTTTQQRQNANNRKRDRRFIIKYKVHPPSALLLCSSARSALRTDYRDQ